MAAAGSRFYGERRYGTTAVTRSAAVSRIAGITELSMAYVPKADAPAIFHFASAVRAKPFHTWCSLKGQQDQWRAKRDQEPNVRPMISH